MAAGQDALKVAAVLASPPLEWTPGDLSPHLRNADVLTLLREASLNAFRVGFPLRHTASPVPLPDGDKSASATVLSFYVVDFKPVLAVNLQVHREVSVRYKDYSQGDVWWSRTDPAFGFVARRMHALPRKARSSQMDEAERLKFRLNGFVFELLKRDDVRRKPTKSRIRDFVVGDAPRFLHYWYGASDELEDQGSASPDASSEPAPAPEQRHLSQPHVHGTPQAASDSAASAAPAVTSAVAPPQQQQQHEHHQQHQHQHQHQPLLALNEATRLVVIVPPRPPPYFVVQAPVSRAHEAVGADHDNLQHRQHQQPASPPPPPPCLVPGRMHWGPSPLLQAPQPLSPHAMRQQQQQYPQQCQLQYAQEYLEQYPQQSTQRHQDRQHPQHLHAQWPQSTTPAPRSFQAGVSPARYFQAGGPIAQDLEKEQHRAAQQPWLGTPHAIAGSSSSSSSHTGPGRGVKHAAPAQQGDGIGAKRRKGCSRGR